MYSPHTKCDNPQWMEEFRLISLMGRMYKIIAEVLSLWCKGVLHRIIDQTETTFLQGRGLLFSVLVANEVIDEFRRNKNKNIIL